MQQIFVGLATAGVLALFGLVFATAAGHADESDLEAVKRDYKAADAEIEDALEELREALDAERREQAEFRGQVKGKLGITEKGITE